MFSYFTKWYLWYYILLVFYGFIYVQQKNKYLETNEGHKLKSEFDYRVGYIFAILVFLPIILIAGYRDRWFSDTGAYVQMFLDWPDSLGELLKEIDWDGKNPGFIIFSVLIKQIFGADYRIWLVIIAAISGVCVAITYKKYTSDIVICAFLFFASTDYRAWMMNGMRQFLVAAILFALFPLVQKRKFIWFILLALVLYTFHNSAIIVIPLYIFALGKPFNKRTLLVLLLCILAVFFANEFLGLMDDSLQSTAYSHLVSEFNDDGTNIMRVLVYSVPAILAVFYRKKLADVPEIINISINMSVITMGLYILSMFTSGIFMGRLPIYFSLFNYILLPWELKNFFNEEQYKFLRLVMIVMYLLYYYISMSGIF